MNLHHTWVWLLPVLSKIRGDLRSSPSYLISYNWIHHQMDTISWSLPLIWVDGQKNTWLQRASLDRISVFLHIPCVIELSWWTIQSKEKANYTLKAPDLYLGDIESSSSVGTVLSETTASKSLSQTRTRSSSISLRLADLLRWTLSALLYFWNEVFDKHQFF